MPPSLTPTTHAHPWFRGPTPGVFQWPAICARLGIQVRSSRQKGLIHHPPVKKRPPVYTFICSRVTVFGRLSGKTGLLDPTKFATVTHNQQTPVLLQPEAPWCSIGFVPHSMSLRPETCEVVTCTTTTYQERWENVHVVSFCCLLLDSSLFHGRGRLVVLVALYLRGRQNIALYLENTWCLY
jgi:hypothetical protein